MRIDHVLRVAETGDLLVTVSSKWVRILTAESFSHAAVILKENDQIYVVQTHEEDNDTTKQLFTEWIKKYDHVYLGFPERVVAENRTKIRDRIYEVLNQPTEKKKYGYWTLPLVWLNQIFPNKKFQHKKNVCSTLVQYLWNATGWVIGKLADPGDLALSCLALHRIEK